MIHFRVLCFTILLAVLTEIDGQPTKRPCAEKEESLALLELAKDSITKAKELVPECKNGNFEDNLDEDTKVEIPDEDPKDETPLPVDCQEVLERGHKASGVYTIRTSHPRAANKSLDVFCDMDTDGGGWTVIQRRGNFSSPLVDFYREWHAYKTGFGNLKEEFWLGNDNIFYLTNQDNYLVRFDMKDTEGVKNHAVYGSFKIEDEQAMYKLHITEYGGTGGDSMNLHNQKKFETKDKINGAGNCPVERKSGWWFYNCADCNPNGLLDSKTDRVCITWYYWKNSYRCHITFFEIKLRRKDKSFVGIKTDEQRMNRDTDEV